MKIILINMLLFISLSDCHIFRCDYSYNKMAEGFFKLHPIPTDWSDARLQCYLEGATLASPSTPEVLKGMSQIIQEKKVYSGVYTGIHATFSKGYFVTIEGIPKSQINLTWASEIPSSRNNKDCAVLVPSDSLYGVDCRETYPFICYKETPNEKESVVNNCGTTDNEYKDDNRTGSCYKFHRVARPWPSAYLTCQAEGGHLAIVNSETEAQVLKNIFNKHPSETLIGAAEDTVALLGFRSWDEHGVMYTLHGDLLEKAGYDAFTPGEPSSSEGEQHCGAMTRSGLLEDIACDTRLSFICEKSPMSIFCDQ